MTSQPRNSFFIVVVATAALVLGACGGPEPTVLELQYGPAGERGANSAADMKMAPLVDVDYEIAPGLVKPATKARAWKASLPGDARTRLADLARALGVEGEVYEQATDQLVVGEQPGTARAGDASVTMWVGGGPASWSYYPQPTAATGAVSEPCAPDAPDAPDAPGCTSPSDSVLRPPVTVVEPKNLPSEAEAVASAKKILSAAGYDVTTLAVDATASAWSTSVSFEELIDGTPTGMFGAIDFGADAVVSSAWGQFARYDGADTYPLIDLEDAVERLGVASFGRFGANGAATAPDTATPPTSVARTVVVRISEVDLVLQPLYTTESDVYYLVPSYRFGDGETQIATVYAVPDKYIAVADPSPVDPATGDSSPDQSGSGSSGSSGSGGAVDPGGAPTPGEIAIADAEAERLVGLTEKEALKVGESNGWTVRVVERDGESYMVTTDWRSDRVNLVVANGTVTAVTVG